MIARIEMKTSLALLLSALLLGCAGTPKPPYIEDEARIMAPPPACIMRLPTRPARGTMRNLKEHQYWELVFPTFEQTRQALPEKAIACTGRDVFADRAFEGATRTDAYPAPVSEGEILMGSGGDRLRVLWMRTHKTESGLDVGPLALVRTRDDFAEVYAVGAYRGRTKRPLFGLERMGVEAIVTVKDEACTGPDYKTGAPCESTLSAYLPFRGVLQNLAVFSTERRDFVQEGEPGSTGSVEYHLTAGVKFAETGATLYEQVVAQDEGGRELRHAELERVFKHFDARLVPNEEPLWPRIFPVVDAKSAERVHPSAPFPTHDGR